MTLRSQKLMKIILSACLLLRNASAYFDMGTTTVFPTRVDTIPRQSFFRWQKVEFHGLQMWYGHWDWDDQFQRRRLCFIAGMSIDFLTIGVATILNRRTLITSDNLLDPFMNRQRDLRIWALGRQGLHTTPYRYRVWRVTRLFPRSLNTEHWHGIRGIHQPRHDVSIIHSLDKMYLYDTYPTRWMYPFKATLVEKREILLEDLWFAGSGFEYLEHIYENYKITFALVKRSFVVDCSIYLPKYWGKFICIKNTKGIAGVQNGGGLFMLNTIVGLGCFEIRYNEDRIFAFTDLRYYYDFINSKAEIEPGEYYEYAYPQWGQKLHYMHDGSVNFPYIPTWQISTDLFPLGKKK